MIDVSGVRGSLKNARLRMRVARRSVPRRATRTGFLFIRIVVIDFSPPRWCILLLSSLLRARHLLSWWTLLSITHNQYPAAAREPFCEDHHRRFVLSYHLGSDICLRNDEHYDSVHSSAVILLFISDAPATFHLAPSRAHQHHHAVQTTITAMFIKTARQMRPPLILAETARCTACLGENPVPVYVWQDRIWWSSSLMIRTLRCVRVSSSLL
jgi:hypothetical protein